MDDTNEMAELYVGAAFILIPTRYFLLPVALDGPVFWYLVGALFVVSILTDLADQARFTAENSPTFFARASSATLTGVRDLVRNFVIAAAIIMALQCGLYVFGSYASPEAVGTLEQRVWEALLAIKRFTSLGVAISIVGGAILLSVLLNTYWPLRFTVRVREWASRGAALLTSLTMFTFVAATGAGVNHERLTGPIRAEIAAKLTEAAAARKEATAYRWVSQTVSEMEINEPEKIAAVQSYFSEGERVCVEFESAYDRSTPNVPIERPRQSLSIGGKRYPLPLHTLEPPLEPSMTLTQRNRQIDNVCFKFQEFNALTQNLVRPAEPTNISPDLRPPGGSPNPVTNERGETSDDEKNRNDSIWLPEFAGKITDRSELAIAWSSIEPGESATQMELYLANATVDVSTASWAQLEEEKAAAERLAANADITRTALRGLAEKSAAKLIGQAFALDGVVGELVDSLRDAVLGELAKRGEVKLKEWLSRNRESGGVIKVASGFMQKALFPELPLAARITLAEQSAKAEAKKVWDVEHPDLTSTIAIAAAARAAVAPGVGVPRIEIPRPWLEPRPPLVKPGPIPRPVRPIIIP